MNETLNLLRPELRGMRAYASAASDRDVLRLHANESPYEGNDSLNRYPEPQPLELIRRLAAFYGVLPANVLATRGSDDAIDLLVRCFCRAGLDSILVCPPTFGMYAIAARLQNAAVSEVRLEAVTGFRLDPEKIAAACNDTTRLVFVCSPNNPTGNLVPLDAVSSLCQQLDPHAIVVVDEAYIEFAEAESCAVLIETFPNLVVLRTLSKAHALAGARCGALVANPQLVEAIRPAMPPYALPTMTIDAALSVLSDSNLRQTQRQIAKIRELRERLRDDLERLAVVKRTWPSEGNFLLAEVSEAQAVIEACREQQILIRDMGAHPGLSRHVRITVGTSQQNRQLIQALESVQ